MRRKPHDESCERRRQADHEQQPHRLQREHELQIYRGRRGGDNRDRVEASGAGGEIRGEGIDVRHVSQAPSEQTA
jgi:hypothetical protein